MMATRGQRGGVWSKMGRLLTRWPQWSLWFLSHNKWSIIGEMKSFDRALEEEQVESRKRSRRRSEFDEEEDIEPYDFGSRLDNQDLASILALACVFLLFLRRFAEAWVDAFVSSAIAFGAVCLVIGFLFAVTNTGASKGAKKRVSRTRLLVEVACVLLSTFPFTLPWFLAFFFPHELLLFSCLFTLGNYVFLKLSHTCSRYDAGEENPNVRSRSRSRPRSLSQPARTGTDSKEHQRALRAYLVSKPGREWFFAFLGLESFTILVAVVLSLAWESFVLDNNLVESKLSWIEIFGTLLLGLLSTSTFLQAFWLQYAAGGRWLHFENGWRFFQPFRGGRPFMALQLCAWVGYALCMSLSAYRLGPIILKALTFVKLPAHLLSVTASILESFSVFVHLVGVHRLPVGTVGALYIATDGLLLASLAVYESSSSARSGANDENELDEEDWVLDDLARTLFLSTSLFAAVKPEFMIAIYSFIVCYFIEDPSYSFMALVTTSVLYAPSYQGRPSLTGSRRCDESAPFSAALFNVVKNHFRLGLYRKGGDEGWDPKHKYIFGYSPHSLFPAGASYIKNTDTWRQTFPGVRPVTLTASITHIVPLLRELNQWSGSLEVSRRGFWAGLDRFSSVMLVPGGQHEMLLIADNEKEYVSTRHKGFIRLAMQRAAHRPDEQCHLVPCFCFGERKTAVNLSIIPMSLQKWCVKRFRTNAAFFPIGRWGLPSVPDRGPVSLVVGEPIKVPIIVGKSKSPTQEQVNLLHRHYYSRLKELFDEHKVIHKDGYQDLELVFEPFLAPMTDDEFKKAWERVKDDSAPYDGETLNQFTRQIDQINVDIPWKEHVFSFFMSHVFLLLPWLVTKTA